MTQNHSFHEQTLVSTKQSIRNRRKRQQFLWSVEIVQSCIRRHLACKQFHDIKKQYNNAAVRVQRLFRAKSSRTLTKFRRLGIHGFKKLQAEDFLRDDPFHIDSLLILAGIHVQLQVNGASVDTRSGRHPKKDAVEETAMYLDRALVAEYLMRKSMSDSDSKEIDDKEWCPNRDFWLMRARSHFKLWARWEHQVKPPVYHACLTKHQKVERPLNTNLFLHLSATQFNCLQASISFDVYLSLENDTSHSSLVEMEIIQSFVGSGWWDRAEVRLQAFIYGSKEAFNDDMNINGNTGIGQTKEEMELLLVTVRIVL